MSRDTRSVVTVEGWGPPGERGVTSPHEHLFADGGGWSVGLVDDCSIDRHLLSYDIYMKMFLTKWGGSGYDYLLREVVPTLEHLGVDDEAVKPVLVGNHRRVRSFGELAA
jgi:predicted metal-dependent phosphotriesterase family hydrolase